MKAIYIAPSIVTAIIIALAVSAAFAIGPTPFIGGVFTGYPPNNEWQGYSLSGAEPTPKGTYNYFLQDKDWTYLIHNIAIDAYNSWADANYFLIYYKDAKTESPQTFEAWIHINFPDFPRSHMQVSPIDHNKMTDNVNPLSNFVRVAGFDPLPENPILHTIIDFQTNKIRFFQILCPAGCDFLVLVDKFCLLAPYIGLASTILTATLATAIHVKRTKHRKEKQLKTVNSLYPFFSYSL
jgi:hypothetical protein